MMQNEVYKKALMLYRKNARLQWRSDGPEANNPRAEGYRGAKLSKQMPVIFLHVNLISAVNVSLKLAAWTIFRR